MQRYNFHIDQKITCWERLRYSIEADSEEEAKQIAIKEFETLTYDDLQECFQIDDTSEVILPENNNNQPTKELYFDYNLILDNGSL